MALAVAMCGMNSWDRQPYLTHSGHGDGYPESEKHGATGASILKEHDVITKNFFVNGYNGVWTIGKIVAACLAQMTCARNQ